MKKYLLGALLALASVAVHATDYVYTDKATTLVARGNKACYPEVVKLLTEDALKLEWRAADLTFEGRQIKACWAIYQGAVAIVDAEGDGGILQQSDFRVLKDV